MKKISNPLSKRVWRELLGEWQKYLVIALFLILMIGFISGMYVANNSMLSSAEKKKEEYILEDGNFELNKKADAGFLKSVSEGEVADIKAYYKNEGYKEADEEVIKAVNEAVADQIKENIPAGNEDYYDELFEAAYDEFLKGDEYKQILADAKKEAYAEVDRIVDEEYDKAADKYNLDDPDYKARKITIYENFYRDAVEDHDLDGEKDGNIRIYKERDDINLYDVLKGSLPETKDEIAIDRMHADNVGIKVGDEIEVSGKRFTVTGLVALVNYSTLYEKPTDSMFDAIYFDVAIVTEEGFDELNTSIHYNYAWRYDARPADETDEKNWSENVMTCMVSNAVTGNYEVEGFLPGYLNQAIHFATDDIGGDKTLASIMLYILVVVLAFIFAITISSTITKESSVIGTLRASGYSKAELVIHYMSMPVLVTLISALIGNILGYTWLKQVVVNMYYNSYSLPSYTTIWTSEAFVKTTVVPVILMFIVNLFVIVRMMRFSPLRFLRHDLKTTKRKKAMRLPRWSFFRRFKLRIFFQNIPNYLVLFMGVSFVMIMLSMAVGFPESLDVYQENVTDMMFAKYQTVLKTTEDDDGNTITTDVKNAEKFCMESLEYRAEKRDESISVYGVADGSNYVDLPEMNENEVYISETFSAKYKIKEGDTLTLNDKYDNGSYEFKVAGIYDYEGSLTVFMPASEFIDVFDKDEDYFTGFMADEEITGIEEKYIATTITEDDVLKISRQLDHSIGSYMVYFQYLCIILSGVLIYLLTKIVIEKNENAISMVKILGYENREISSLYMTGTTIMVIVSCLGGSVIGYFAMDAAFKVYLMSMEGWFNFVISPLGFAKMFVFGFVSYLLVMMLDYRRIKRIPMDEALKNVE